VNDYIQLMLDNMWASTKFEPDNFRPNGKALRLNDKDAHEYDQHIRMLASIFSRLI
jgi:hypothetical protein